MFKTITAFVFLSFLFISCSDDIQNPDANSIDQSCRVTSIKVSTLIFDDGVTVNGYNETFSGKFRFQYDGQQRIVKVLGGLQLYGSLQNFANWALSDDSYDTVVYSGDTISVKYSDNYSYRPYDKRFVIANGQLVYRKVKAVNHEPAEYSYEYNGDQIIERQNGLLSRTYTIQNGNLTQVEAIQYSFGVISSRIVTKFTDYDNTPNLVKGKFFLNGCFYKAFSNNNYHVCTRKIFTYSDGIETPYDESFYEVGFGYDSDNISDLFERECN